MAFLIIRKDCGFIVNYVIKLESYRGQLDGIYLDGAISVAIRLIGVVDIGRGAHYSRNVCQFETTVLLNINIKPTTLACGLKRQ